MNNISSQMEHLDHVVVVDSSTDDKAQEVMLSFKQSKITYLKSGPGLPYQRNQGIALLANTNEPSEVVAFLDDDVIVPNDYFDKVSRQFALNTEALAICGFDMNLQDTGNSKLRRLLGLRRSNDEGLILNSGIAVPVYQPKETRRVDWAPGHSLNVRSKVFRKILFDSSIRMYGEDVDFCLRLGALGKILISPELGVSHNPETSGRDGLMVAESFNAGFRYSLAEKYPQKVSKTAVIFTSLVLAAGYWLSGIVNRDPSRLARGTGLALFLAKVVVKKPVVQSHSL